MKRLKRPCLYRTHTKYITVAVKISSRTTITDTSTDINRLCVKGLAALSESIMMKTQGVNALPCSMPPNRGKYNCTCYTFQTSVYTVMFLKEKLSCGPKNIKNNKPIHRDPLNPSMQPPVHVPLLGSHASPLTQCPHLKLHANPYDPFGQTVIENMHFKCA